jgi:hypothetical protein
MELMIQRNILHMHPIADLPRYKCFMILLMFNSTMNMFYVNIE